MKETEYIKKVDALLKDECEKRRTELLHQNTPYGDVLAFGGDWLSPEGRAERVARTLMFHLGEAYFFEKLPKLQDCFGFLRGALLYLELACPESDKTYEGLMKLVRLSWSVRAALPSLGGEGEKYECYLTLFRTLDTPFDPDILEAILLSMTDWSWEDVS
ncbi:MAG: hypothetical protein IJ452_08855 [Butyricicoccus sp.]|nr:hypothetical protein [Butyricicoccus sp.]MBQ8586373.1 hypothetical protein [Butyricicoccus sp.]